MNVIVGSDASTHLPKAVLDDLLQRGHQVNRGGPLAGTGVCLAADKVPDVRAVLCADAETAPGCGTGPTSCACRSAARPRLRLARSSRPGWPPRTAQTRKMTPAWPS